MAEKIISPGVFTKEIDASFLPAAVGDIGAVVVGPTVKGPALVPTVVTSYADYQAKFGDVFRSGSGYYQYLTSHTAKNYLQHAGKLTVVRIMGAGYAQATGSVITDGQVGGSTYDATFASSSFSFLHVPSGSSHSSSQADEITIGGVDFTFISSSAGLTNTSTQIFVDFANNDADSVLAASTTTTTVAANFRDAINNSSSLHNLNISASTTGSAFGADAGDTNMVTISGSYAGTAGNHTITTGSGNDSVATTVGFISGASGADFGDAGFNTEGGLDTSTASETSFVLHTLADGEIMNSIGDSGVSDTTIGNNEVLPDGTSNNLRWEVSTVNKKKGTFNLLIRRGDDTIKQKQTLETWNNLSLDPKANNYIDKIIGNQDISINQTDASDPFLTYNGDYTNKSKYVRVETIKKTPDYLDENGNIRLNDAAIGSHPSMSLPAVGSGSVWGAFGGATDGTVTHPITFNENITNTSTQGFDLSVAAQKEQYTVALNLLANKDEYDFNLLLLPGIVRSFSNHTSIVTKAIDICEDRGDAFYIADTVDYSTDNLGSVITQAKAMNSNYAATYWPWIQTTDSQTGQNVWVPPSVVMGGIYAFNDKIAAPWNAPAGLLRGGIDTAVQAKRKLTHKNRDDLYSSNVNPLATFPGQGVVVWGQKTLQKKNSALDRVNVRRLLIKVKKFIAASSRFLVFEQNNATTRERFLNIANPYLEQIQSQSGLNAFRVVMDESNNTPDVVDRNILYGQLFLQPTRTAEFIVLDFTVQPTGATFPE